MLKSFIHLQVIEIVKDQIAAQITTMIKHRLSYLAKWFALAGALILTLGVSLIAFPEYTPYILGGLCVAVAVILFAVAVRLALWR